MRINYVVIFGADGNGARIKKGIKPEEWANKPNCLVAPDLTSLAGIPPHEWQLKDGTIVPKRYAPLKYRVYRFHKAVTGKLILAIVVHLVLRHFGL